jgi:hypothetical protein
MKLLSNLNTSKEKAIMMFAFFLLSTSFQPAVAQKYNMAFGSEGFRGPNPVITDILTAINKDSLSANIQMMVNMGTRYMYAENRRHVAEVIGEKFRSYGYPRVEIDSFRMVGEFIAEDSVWQYNVVATLTGSSAPGEIYILSAHHDDYCYSCPLTTVPGADDDASGCAVLLEIARVIKSRGFQPASTIRFVTYAAEELVGYKNYSGSMYYSEKVFAGNEDLRLVFNNDMVAYAADSANSMFGTILAGPDAGWPGDLLVASASTYGSSLTIMAGEYPTGDATSFHNLGYPVSGFQEYNLNPTYHTIQDSVSNCNMDICREVTRVTAATLLNEQLTPVPQSLSALMGKSSVTLTWKPTQNSNVTGYNIYRSVFPDSVFTIIGQAGDRGASFSDTTAKAGTLYYYYVTSFDNQQFESIPATVTRGALFQGNKDLLVVKDSRGGLKNPSDSSVNEYYRQVFRDLVHDYSDASVADSLNLLTLGRYQRIFWLSNTNSSQTNSSFRRNSDDITSYLRSGGQLFIGGFNPTFMIAGNTSMDKPFVSSDIMNNVYKISQVQRKPTAYLNGAWPCENEYDTIHIDPAKCLPNPKNHIFNLESISPAADASVIYRFNTAYDTTSVFGNMKGKPVGIEYLGDDYKLIILTVPLYYIDSLEAKNLAELIVKQKFISHVGTEERQASLKKSLVIRSFPNPFQDKVSLEVNLPQRDHVSLTVFDILGNEIRSLSKALMGPGLHTISLDLSGCPKGVYTCRLVSGKLMGSGIIIKE